MNHKSAIFLSSLLMVGAGATAVDAARIRFDAPVYEVDPGEVLIATVEIESPPAEGLFSYGVEISFDPILNLITDPAGIDVPPELDFNGVNGPPAFRDVGAGFAGVKGTINAFLPIPIGYTGNTLATFELTFAQPGDYQLDLGLFRTLGPNEDIFISGTGVKLDPTLTFEGANVTVVPEPTARWLMLLGILGLLVCGRRKRLQIRR